MHAQRDLLLVAHHRQRPVHHGADALAVIEAGDQLAHRLHHDVDDRRLHAGEILHRPAGRLQHVLGGLELGLIAAVGVAALALGLIGGARVGHDAVRLPRRRRDQRLRVAQRRVLGRAQRAPGATEPASRRGVNGSAGMMKAILGPFSR